MAMRNGWHIGRDRPALPKPFRQAAVQYRGGLVADPAQHPPQSRCHRAVARVVADQLVRRLDSLLTQPGDEPTAIG
jgi:hypothetical protein